jgi:uncharacterized protein YndB with AHSA1/START domain
MTGEENPGAQAGRQVQIAHVFDAPPELVFEAFVDPDQVAQWWAPEGFEVPRESVDVDARVGGRIHFTMAESGGGAEYPVHFEIVELSRPQLLVMRSPAMPEVGIDEPTLTRVELEPDGDGTRVTVTQGPHTDEMAANAEAGWRGSFEKLDVLLGS